jgi:uncharacterized membrane protein YqgA involved in biofilm formation
MFKGLGTLLNVSTIIIGSILGILVGSRFKEQTRELITTALGFITLLAAADSIKGLWSEKLSAALPNGWPILIVLFSLLLGALIGQAVGVEDRMERFGSVLKDRFDKNGTTPFIEGFVSSSLLFVIGPMAILGSISDGMGTGISQLTLKSILDGITSIAFAASLGWGVAGSALPVGIYQLGWTAIGIFLGNVLPEYQIVSMTTVGGILLLGISFRLLRLKNVPVGNLLPALFLAPLIAGLVHQFN